MRRAYLIGAALLIGVAIWPAAAAGQGTPRMPPCTECHSKNPGLVRMHSALEFKDCLSCHGGRPSFGNSGGMRVPRTERCVRCHETQPGIANAPVAVQPTPPTP